jgi:hypothetical protein
MTFTLVGFYVDITFDLNAKISIQIIN